MRKRRVYGLFERPEGQRRWKRIYKVPPKHLDQPLWKAPRRRPIKVALFKRAIETAWGWWLAACPEGYERTFRPI